MQYIKFITTSNTETNTSPASSTKTTSANIVLTEIKVTFVSSLLNCLINVVLLAGNHFEYNTEDNKTCSKTSGSICSSNGCFAIKFRNNFNNTKTTVSRFVNCGRTNAS